MNVEDFKEIVSALEPLVGSVTDSAVAIAVLYIGFKLLIELAVPLCLMLLIHKIVINLKPWLMQRKIVVANDTVAVSMDGKLISTDDNVKENLFEAFRICREDVGLFKSQYMHKEHTEFLLDAVRQKAKSLDESKN